MTEHLYSRIAHLRFGGSVLWAVAITSFLGSMAQAQRLPERYIQGGLVACCCPDGECIDVTNQPECQDACGGNIQPGFTCADKPCGAVCEPGKSGDCCAGNGSPGCEDPECCACVCSFDAFCCGQGGGAWDSLCADQAVVGGACADVCPCGGAIGACCLADESCMVTSEEDCNAIGGSFQGVGTHCGELVYSIDECANPFEDISATGIEAPNASNLDDNGDIVPIGFNFNFFEDSHTTIGVTSNGYLTFGNELTEFTNATIPDSTPPNDLIAPMWDDWSPNQGGTVHYQTLGTAGTRRFIAQWTDVPHFDLGGSSSFQAILYEADDCIEYRYGEIILNTPTVGVENQDGTVGFPGGLGPVPTPGDCLRLCPLETPAPCATCPWDCDGSGDGRVTILDLLAVVSGWAMPGPCDSDLDGTISVVDLLAIIGNWGFCPDCLCPPAGVSESEPCGDDVNGGCNSTPPAFGSVTCGDLICGTAWADGNERDTDWYELNLSDPDGVGTRLLSARADAEFPTAVFVLDGIGACAPVVVGNVGCATECQNLENAAATLPVPGTYAIFLATGNCDGSSIFEGFPCGTENDYVLRIFCSDCGDGAVQSGEECDPPDGVTCDANCQALEFICGPGAGDCCSANDTPGCDDIDCCEAVCDMDSFCCEVTWDGFCAEEALKEPLCPCAANSGGLDPSGRPQPSLLNSDPE